MIFVPFFAHIAAWHNRRQRMEKVRQELENYTDRQLRDLGIPRWDIPQFARSSVK